MSRAHEAGALHAEAGHRGPHWLREPADPNALVPQLWSATARRDPGGVVEVGGVALPELAAEHDTPVYVLDEEDFRSRAAAFRDAFDGADVYYAGKAFMCSTVLGWIAEEGLSLDVCTGGELGLALRAGFAPARIALHGNNKSDAELERALTAGVGRIVVDSRQEVERLSRLAATHDARPQVLVRVTVGVEAHTHEYIATAHEDQKFGLSLAGGEAFAVAARVHADPRLRLLGLHSHIGSQIWDTSGFEVAARRVLGLHARVRDELGVTLPELGLGGGFGIAYTTQDDPQPVPELASGLRAIVAQECRARGLVEPRLSVEPGRAVAGPAMCTLYRVGTTKAVPIGPTASRLYVSVDGGMSDNIRPALYDADYSCTVANRASVEPPVLARVVGSHCESGDVVVKDEFLPGDIQPGDLLAVPGTGAYCRPLASNYNHLPRPGVVAVRGGSARVVLRRETEEELYALDVSAPVPLAVGAGGAR